MAMVMMKTLLLLVAYSGLIYGAGLDEFLRKATSIAGALGTQSSGTMPRSKGCVINWSYQGMLMGFEWKYMAVCTDSCTHDVETVYKQSREGAVEHCLGNLLNKVAAKQEL